MGKVIVYCEGCGERLKEDDFQKGRAQQIENRNWCARCKPIAPTPPRPVSRPAIPAARPSAGPRPASPPPPRRRALVAGVAGGVVALAIVVAIASGKKTSPAVVDEPRRPTQKWITSDLLREIEAFAATKPEPDVLLTRCDAARPKLKGTPDEFRLKAIEEGARRELEIRRERGRLDAALRQFREVSTSDAGFKRREEMARLLRSAAEIAGPRKLEVERLILDYDKAWSDAARKSMEAIRADAERLAAEGRLSEAFARLEELPDTFAPLVGSELARARPELERRASELKERRAAAWRAWAPQGQTGDLLDEHEGRRVVLVTHPRERNSAAYLERELALGAGKRWTLSAWVAPHQKGDWDLRILVDGELKASRTVGPKGSGWTLARFDLSPWAGARAKIRLENAANGWEFEHGYWHAVEVVEGDGDALTLPVNDARREGQIQIQNGGESIGAWFDGSAEWSLNVAAAGEYAVELTYALGHQNPVEMAVEVAGRSAAARPLSTGSWDEYRTMYPASFHLPAGSHVFRIRSVAASGGLMNLKQVRLYRLP